MKLLEGRLVSVVLLMGLSAAALCGQFPDRQIPVVVIPRPRKAIFSPGEPILVDIEIRNDLKAEIRLNALSFSPNDWNGETLCIELPDVYRLPDIKQIWLERPKISPPKYVSGGGWYAIPAGTSKVKTVDVSKWKVLHGWVPGKYQIVVRADKIDADKYTWMSVSSDPIVFEIR